MALPSGTFSSVFAGALRVSVSAEITIDDVTYPYLNDGSITLRAYVNNGSFIVYLPTINQFASSASFVLAYPGGGVVWSLGVEVIATTFKSSNYIAARNIQLAAELYKR
jgi:hypothetical protein